MAMALQFPPLPLSQPRTLWDFTDLRCTPSAHDDGGLVADTPDLAATLDFYLTCKHRTVIRDDQDREIYFQEDYDGAPRSRHPRKLKLQRASFLGQRDILKAVVLNHLSDLGVDPVSREEITVRILMVIDAAIERRKTEVYASVDLEVTRIEVCWVAESDNPTQQNSRGVSEEAIRRLDGESFVAAAGTDVGTCAICLEHLSSRRRRHHRRLSKMACEHIFHTSCILRWLRTARSCPMCRQEIDDC